MARILYSRLHSAFYRMHRFLESAEHIHVPHTTVHIPSLQLHVLATDMQLHSVAYDYEGSL